MKKLITILEIPIYLLVIGMCCFEHGNSMMGIFLLGLSIIRLWVNHITWKGE